MTSVIQDISDTARWIAYCRALETERPDALFHDRHARELAGPRGEEIVRRLRWARHSAWVVAVRTAVMDELLMRSLAESGISCVLNLAAGLDTRPYRLDLPPGMRWIEVDLPALIDEKERRLAGERPRCDLERVRLDLSDQRSRAALLDKVAAAGRDTLVISEGLLTYMEGSAVEALCRELAARARLRRWLLDLSGPVVLRRLYKGRSRRDLEAGGSRMRFAPDEGPDFFRPFGWRPTEVRYSWDEGRRLGREPWWMKLIWWTSTANRRRPYQEMTRYLLLERDVREPAPVLPRVVEEAPSPTRPTIRMALERPR